MTSEVTQRAGREELNYDVPRGGSTALLFAARSGDVESARLLIAAGADVNDTLPDGASALVVAAHSGTAGVAALLLDKGADPDAAAIGYTALHAAVLRSDLDLVKALLAHKAEPERADHEGHAGQAQQPGLRAAEDADRRDALSARRQVSRSRHHACARGRRRRHAAAHERRRDAVDGRGRHGHRRAGAGRKRGTDRRGLAILDGGKVEPDSQVLEAVIDGAGAGQRHQRGQSGRRHGRAHRGGTGIRRRRRSCLPIAAPISMRNAKAA